MGHLKVYFLYGFYSWFDPPGGSESWELQEKQAENKNVSSLSGKFREWGSGGGQGTFVPVKVFQGWDKAEKWQLK